MKTSILWFRNDLRTIDNATLTAAAASQELLPVYFLDPREEQAGSYGIERRGVYRTNFLYQTLADLRITLRELGSDLYIIKGSPAEILPRIARDIGAERVYWGEEAADEERRLEQKVRSRLQEESIVCRSFWGSTLYHKEDLPFSIERLPDIFTSFRKEVEKRATVRATLPEPECMPPLPPVVPELEQADISLVPVESDVRCVLSFEGGQMAAWERLEEYFFERDCLRNYKETRNGLIGADYSSKFSPWLANGSLSPRSIFEEVKQYEAERIQNDSTYWLIFELIWRDYFKFVSLKYGSALFKHTGIRGEKVRSRWQPHLFEAWMQGTTGVPFIDANMRELAATGFMSNRGRQNVASFLVKDLGLPWLAGAEYFESLLLDYDPDSNYGNWNYVASVGNDPRENRYFNPLRQAQMYDPKGDYVRRWLPELSEVETSLIHTPWRQSSNSGLFTTALPQPYDKPVIDLEAFIRRNSSR